ncbi:MAG: hypothetical protein C4524_11875 [Candidatus Zixiibacteriota bacterium]|nr:MAG: hypothetical protein C4524_11875 [candidate division Zixibacteria bacterium]
MSLLRRGVGMPAWGCAVLLLLSLALTAQGRPREALPADLLEQWHQLKAQGSDQGRTAELLAEGERIILRLEELDDLRRDPKNASSSLDQRVLQLQDRFRDLLRRLEMTRVSQLSRGELQAMRDRYDRERAQLELETRALEDSIIARGEYFLATYKQNINYSHYLSKQEMIVDFLYRLAEIYYRRGEETFYTTNDIAAFKPALEKYQRIIDEFPASEYVDDALYNIAYVKNTSRLPDDQQEAIKLYRTLIEKYSSSGFVPEAYWRVAEYYFYQEPPQIVAAIDHYSALLNYPDTHWYARGLYKIGWCHFRQADYPQAINFFTQTVEASLDSATAAQDVLFSSMLDEALEYVSVCYAQDEAEWDGAGVDECVTFVQSDSLRRRTYGRRLLEYLGDIYRAQVGKYDRAVDAYTACLDLYPLAPEAPWVREKVITTCAVSLRDFARAYDEKNRLFDLYRAGTDWSQANPDSALRARADEIVERYYVQNIGETIGRALQDNDPDRLDLAVQMSRSYLEVFPQGPNAYTVNFNLAVLLEQHLKNPEAAYAEYLKVSRDYPDLSHQKESAVNAVIIAQRLVNAEGRPADSLLGRPISDAEVKFVDAAENYLALFPQGEEAEVFLLNTGSIYYNHGQYPESRRYYETLLTEFPQGNRRGDAYRYIMNGYFAEQNYAEAERVSKEIQAAGFDPDLVAAAKTRQAESAFLTAEGLKAATHFLEAATEFKRTALESPDYPQADKALFESGLAYQQGQAWPEANEVYLLLVERYPQSPQADKALYNVAYNSQAEMGEKATAAATFERLAREYPQSPLAQDALRNASINYGEAQDWAGAIRVNTLYTQMFPQAGDANVYLFENAGLYLKLGDEAAAEQIYADYARRYPDDPRTVRAHWERGNFLKDKGRATEAYGEFAAGIAAHRRLTGMGQPGEETYASRCLLEVVRGDFASYEAVQFAPANAVAANKQTKLARRDALLAQLEELNRMGKDEMLEGLYLVGKVEEELSRAFQNQELPAKAGADEKILDRETANQDAIEIGVKAMAAYRKASEDMAAAAAVLRAKEGELAARREQLSAWVIEAQKSDPQPQDLPDSTAALADVDRGLQEVRSALAKSGTWAQSAREKIPELALRNAEIKLATVKAFLALPDAGKTEDLKMAYRAGVLTEFAAPRGAEVVRLYRAAIGEAGGRGQTLPSQEAGQTFLSDSGGSEVTDRNVYPTNSWVARSLEGTAELFKSLEVEFRALNERILGVYGQYYADYQGLLAQGEGAVTSRGLEAADVAEKLVIYSGQSAECAKGALQAQAALLAAAEEGEEIPAELRSRLLAAALEEIFRLNERYAALAAEAGAAKAQAQARGSESVVWEDAVMTYEDCAYNFAGRQEELLAAGYDFNRAHGNDQPLALRLAWALAGLDRETYLPLLAEHGQEAWIRSDQAFRVSPAWTEGWESLDGSEEGWTAPAEVIHFGHEADELAGSLALWLEVTDRNVLPADRNVYPTDSSEVGQALLSDRDSTNLTDINVSPTVDSLYLRRVFDLGDEPVAGDLWISAEGGFSLLLNGEFVGAVEPGADSPDPVHYDVAPLLKRGRNLVAILALEAGLRNPGVRLALRYKTLPSPSHGGPNP